MKRGYIKSILRTFMLMLLLACTSQQRVVQSASEEPDYRLNDIWALEILYGKTVASTDYAKERPYLEINLKEERYAGTSGCNRIFGKVKTEGERLVFLEGGSTRMFCPGDLEVRLLKTLSKVKIFKIENNRLRLSDGSAEILVFNKVD